MLGIGIGLFSNVAALSGGGGAGTTWSAATDWTLSAGNLTATRTANTAFWAPVRASAAKTNGTAIYTVVAVGGTVFDYVGFDTGGESQDLGHDTAGTGTSIGWKKDGSIFAAGGLYTTVASWGAGDQLKLGKAGKNFSFYKMVSGSWALQTTVDITVPTGSPSAPLVGAAYPIATNGNSTGPQYTADFSGW